MLRDVSDVCLHAYIYSMQFSLNFLGLWFLCLSLILEVSLFFFLFHLLFLLLLEFLLGFPGGSDGKESACNAGDLDSWRMEWLPTYSIY